MVEIIKKTIRFAKERLKDVDPTHGIKHARITAFYSEIIAEKENADADLCIIAAWLHDIARPREWVKETETDNHGISSAKEAGFFLKKIGLGNSEIKKVCEAISSHCFPLTQKSLISKILWDADKLNIFSLEMERAYVCQWSAKTGGTKRGRKKLEEEKRYYRKYFNTNTAREIVEELTIS